MSNPRNRPAYLRSQNTRSRIRSFLSGRPSTMPPPSAEHVRDVLGLQQSARTVRWHMRLIRLETLEALDHVE